MHKMVMEVSTHAYLILPAKHVILAHKKDK